MTRLVNRGQRYTVVEPIIMAKLGIPLVDKSMWGRQSAFTRSRTHTEAIQAIARLGIKSAKRSPSHSPQPVENGNDDEEEVDLDTTLEVDA